MATKVFWTLEEKLKLLEEVQKQFNQHPEESTLNLTQKAIPLALPKDRRRELTGTKQVDWIEAERKKWPDPRFKPTEPQPDEYVPIKDRPIFVAELPEKPKLVELLSDILADTMVQVFAEAIAKARERLDLPIVEHHQEPCKKEPLKKVAIYGLFSNQEKEVRRKLDGLLDMRFIKYVSQAKMVSSAQWADHFVLMTKFVSHDYEAVKKYKNLKYCNGGVSSLINLLEGIYLGDAAEPSV